MTIAPVPAISDEDRIARLRLIRSDNVGPATYADLIAHFGSAAAALDAIPDLARRGGRALRVCSRSDAEREITAGARLGVRIVVLEEADYPPWLRAIDGPPPLVSIRGDGAATAGRAVAIVGSRNASIVGRKFAAQLARELGDAGYVVVSGLARGIDAAAHQAALETRTVAVFAGGLDRLYPPENESLAADILARGGAHISEMPLGWEPRARDFPRRNRIISGISLGVVVVEAALRSGSLITARQAGQQGRLVFSVPGSPLDPRAGGTNLLIKEGATLVTGVDDILSELEPMLAREPERIAPHAVGTPSLEPADADRDKVLEALGPSPVALDDVIRFTGLPAGTVRVLLLELDLAGRLAHHPGGAVSLVP